MDIKEFNTRIDKAIDFVRLGAWGGYSCTAIGHAFSKNENFAGKFFYDNLVSFSSSTVETIYSKTMAQNERCLFVSDIRSYAPEGYINRQVRRQDFIEHFREYCLSIELYKEF